MYKQGSNYPKEGKMSALMMKIFIWIGIGAIIFIISKRTKAKRTDGAISFYEQGVEEIIRETLPDKSGYVSGFGYLIEGGYRGMLYSYASMVGNSSGSTTGSYKYRRYFTIAIGQGEIIFIPCKFRLNIFKGLKLEVDKKKSIEKYPLTDVEIKIVKEGKNGIGGENSVEIEFNIPDENQARNIEFFVRPEIWGKVANCC
jgi:hypothetical protein